MFLLWVLRSLFLEWVCLSPVNELFYHELPLCRHNVMPVEKDIEFGCGHVTTRTPGISQLLRTSTLDEKLSECGTELVSLWQSTIKDQVITARRMWYGTWAISWRTRPQVRRLQRRTRASVDARGDKKMYLKLRPNEHWVCFLLARTYWKCMIKAYDSA